MINAAIADCVFCICMRCCRRYRSRRRRCLHWLRCSYTARTVWSHCRCLLGENVSIGLKLITCLPIHCQATEKPTNGYSNLFTSDLPSFLLSVSLSHSHQPPAATPSISFFSLFLLGSSGSHANIAHIHRIRINVCVFMWYIKYNLLLICQQYTSNIYGILFVSWLH